MLLVGGIVLFLVCFYFFGRQIALAILTILGHLVILFAPLFGADKEIPEQEARGILFGKVLTHYQRKNNRQAEHSPYLTLLGKFFATIGDSYRDKELFYLVNQLQKRRFVRAAGVVAYYLDVKPHNHNGEAAFIFGGAWNDPEGIMPIIWDYYAQGFRVVSVSHPDAKAALVDTRFLHQSISDWDNIDAHVLFIDRVIDQLIGGKPFRLCGYSTGGNTMAGLLHFWLADHVTDHFANLKEVRIISPASTRKRQLPQFVGDLFRNMKHLKKMPTEWEGIVNAYTQKTTCEFGLYWRLIKVVVTATQSVKSATAGSKYWASIISQLQNGANLPTKLVIQYDRFDQVVNPEPAMRPWCIKLWDLGADVELQYFTDNIGHGAILYNCAKRAMKDQQS